MHVPTARRWVVTWPAYLTRLPSPLSKVYDNTSLFTVSTLQCSVQAFLVLLIFLYILTILSRNLRKIRVACVPAAADVHSLMTWLLLLAYQLLLESSLQLASVMFFCSHCCYFSRCCCWCSCCCCWHPDCCWRPRDCWRSVAFRPGETGVPVNVVDPCCWWHTYSCKPGCWRP